MTVPDHDRTQLQSHLPLNPPGDRLPPVPGFELLREVGRGGMGVVYAARDLALGRDVAVKLLQDRFPAGGSAARRFVEESQISSQLQHPGVPPVHQVGALADGRPFLVMKLIKGDTLDRLLAARPDPSAERGRFVAAFEQVCQAVGYAHAHGVIHRDLKPANVMVGSFAEVQVMDWGLAKVLSGPTAETAAGDDGTPRTAIGTLREPGSGTQTGSVMGTPAFMPPEQAGGEVAKIDARSDVFALGGILCVILTGRPPYTGDTAAVHLMAIRGQLDDARARLDGCGAEPELVALCRRCLSAEPGDRPADANAVAAAVAGLRAEAEGRARQAELARVRASAEAGEQRKRRRAQLALAAAVGLLLAGAGAFGWWQDRQATERRLRAEQARQSIGDNLGLAVQLRKPYRFREAGDAIEVAAGIARAHAPELIPDVDRARREHELVIELDDIRFRKWVWSLDAKRNGSWNTKTAPAKYRQALAAREIHPATADPAEVAAQLTASGARDELVAAIDDWALYETDDAVRGRLLAIARRVDPGEWNDRLRDPAVRSDKAAVARLAAEVAAAAPPAQAVSVLSELMRRAQLSPEEMLAAARARHPGDFELSFALARWQMNRTSDGREVAPFEAARALRPDNLSVWNNIGFGLLKKGDTVGAIAALREALRRDPKFATAHVNLGDALKRTGDADGARAAFENAIQCDPNDKFGYKNLGLLLLDARDWDGAVAAFREAIRCEPGYADSHNNLGVALDRKGDTAGARAAFEEAVRLDPRDTNTLTNLAKTLQAQRDLPGAIARYRAALDLDPKYVDARNNLGSALILAGDLDGAAAAFRAVIQVNPDVVEAYRGLGLALSIKKDWEGAAVAWREALVRAPGHAETRAALLSALHTVAKRRDSRGDVEGALELITEAYNLNPTFDNAPAKMSSLLHDRGALLYVRGNLPAAVAAWKAALMYYPKNPNALYKLGVYCSLQKDIRAAAACARAATQSDPFFVDAYVLLGKALEALGDVPGAREAYKAAALLDARLSPLLNRLPPLPVAPAPRPVNR